MKRLLIATSIILSILFNLMGTVGYASEPVWTIKLLSYDVSYEFNDTDSLMEFQLDLGSTSTLTHCQAPPQSKTDRQRLLFH